MEFLRNAAKTWVAKLLMALLVMSFGIWGIRDVSTSFLSDFLSWTGWGPKDLVHVAAALSDSQNLMWLYNGL